MATPVVARPKPCLINVKAGRTYFWCSCGRSAKQPFCDGSHEGTGFSPMKFKATKDDELLFCGCKHTRNGPFCDGAHTNLPGGSPLDDPAPGAEPPQPATAASANPNRITRMRECTASMNLPRPLLDLRQAVWPSREHLARLSAPKAKENRRIPAGCGRTARMAAGPTREKRPSHSRRQYLSGSTHRGGLHRP